jgi:hypothetical protein
VLGEQHAGLVPPQRPVADGDGDAVGVRVGGDRDVGVGGQRQQQVERAGLLRVGEGDGREVGVRLGLLGDDRRRGEAGPLEGGEQRLEPDAVHRRVGDADVARVRARQGGDADR